MMMMMTTQKRKAVDQFNHDFSDFSLSSPATKIRRLDHVELAPIIEEEEEEPLQHEDEEQRIATEAGVDVENEERAIVLFNPANPFIHSPPPTFSLTPHILSRLKGQSHLSNLFNRSSSSNQDEETDTALDDGVIISNQCTAVVPWVKSNLSPCLPSSGLDASESTMMEADAENQQEEVATSMDIEQGYNAAVSSGNATEYEGHFHQWQQQHCMVPSQLPPPPPPHSAAAAATPVVWFN
ncbi:uncharacterized protein LOC108225373 [Daucus carota subsp. sativus]|nr:PREDICTED: uncharacterized protein LOC108225373 [Daucus carota subsp. sativus]